MLLTMRKTLLSDFDYFENLLEGIGNHFYSADQIKEHIKNNNAVSQDFFVDKKCYLSEENNFLNTFKFMFKSNHYDSQNYHPFYFIVSSSINNRFKIHEVGYKKKDYTLVLTIAPISSNISISFLQNKSYKRESFEFGSLGDVHVSSYVNENIKKHLKTNTAEESFKLINQMLGIEIRTQEEKELDLLNNDYKLEDIACCGTLIKAEDFFSYKTKNANKIKIS